MMLLKYSYLQNNGQKTKFLQKLPKTPAVEATSSERVYYRITRVQIFPF